MDSALVTTAIPTIVSAPASIAVAAPSSPSVSSSALGTITVLTAAAGSSTTAGNISALSAAAMPSSSSPAPSSSTGAPPSTSSRSLARPPTPMLTLDQLIALTNCKLTVLEIRTMVPAMYAQRAIKNEHGRKFLVREDIVLSFRGDEPDENIVVFAWEYSKYKDLEGIQEDLKVISYQDPTTATALTSQRRAAFASAQKVVGTRIAAGYYAVIGTKR